MIINDVQERIEAKSPEQRFMRMLEQEFEFAPRVAQVILEEAQTSLQGTCGDSVRPGQTRVLLVRREAGHGRALREIETVEVTWTIDAGAEDEQIRQRHGQQALRQVRIQRLLLEALEQGAVATQEDLARVLNVSLRTIKRDCAALQAKGVYLPTRGNLHGIGRGQTHKAQIIGRWLRGETYDQIALHTHHRPVSIQRYIQTFVRLVKLHRQGFSENEIGLLLQLSPALVREYLAVYRQHDTPDCQERLQDQLRRLDASSAAKRGA
jgi:CRP-like cAMP-binding protein